MWVVHHFAGRGLLTAVSFRSSILSFFFFPLLVVFGSGSESWENNIFCTLLGDSNISPFSMYLQMTTEVLQVLIGEFQINFNE